LKLPPDNRLRTPPVTPWAIPAFIEGASWSGAYEAAGVSSQANTWAQRAQNVIASYVVGGVAAELDGGKFANGGMSAAFSRVFNDLSDYKAWLLTPAASYAPDQLAP
jgi:hypothetical protein